MGILAGLMVRLQACPPNSRACQFLLIGPQIDLLAERCMGELQLKARFILKWFGFVWKPQIHHVRLRESFCNRSSNNEDDDNLSRQQMAANEAQYCNAIIQVLQERIRKL